MKFLKQLWKDLYNEAVGITSNQLSIIIISVLVVLISYSFWTKDNSSVIFGICMLVLELGLFARKKHKERNQETKIKVE